MTHSGQSLLRICRLPSCKIFKSCLIEQRDAPVFLRDQTAILWGALNGQICSEFREFTLGPEASMSANDPKRTSKALSRPAGPSPSSPQHRPLGLREGQRGDERDSCADRDIPEEPAAVADVAEPLYDQRSGAAE